MSGTIVFKWNSSTSTYSSSTYSGSSWSNPNPSFSVGEGARIYSPSAQSIVAKGSFTSGTVSYILPPYAGKSLIGPIGFGATPNQSYGFTWSQIGMGYPASTSGAKFFTINSDGTETQSYVSPSGTVSFVYGAAKFFQGLPGRPYQEWNVTRTVW